MSDYIWEMGIDWNAIETVGLSYLRQGFVKVGNPSMLARPFLQKDDTITFRIFDVTSSNATPSAMVTEIKSFVIITKAAVDGQSDSDPLSSDQPPVMLDLTTAPSTVFTDVLRSWTSDPQPVLAADSLVPNRFLLTFQTRALGSDGNSRTFVHDPEMVVGGDGG
jgi:hypothetical protein